MRFDRGEFVIVKDFRGRKVKQLVWEDNGSAVFVTSEEGFALLANGDESFWAVGIHRDDIVAPAFNGS